MDREIEEIQMEIEYIKNNVGLVKGFALKENTGGSETSDPTALEVLNREQLLNRLRKQLNALVLQRNIINATVEELEEDLKLLFKYQFKTTSFKSNANVIRLLGISNSKYYRDKERLINIFQTALND